MKASTDTPKIKRARYIASTGDRAEIDRLRERYEAELHTPGLTSKHRQDLERALDVLEQAQWGDRPELQDRHEGRRRRANQPRARQHKPKAKTPAQPKRRTPTIGQHVRQAAGERFQQTGIPQASESTSQFIMRALGGLAGLSFLYLMVRPNGVRALQSSSNGLVYGLQALVSPHVDPLHATRRDLGTRAPSGLAAVNPNPYAITRPLSAPSAPAIPTVGPAGHRPAPTVRYVVPTP